MSAMVEVHISLYVPAKDALAAIPNWSAGIQSTTSSDNADNAGVRKEALPL